MYISEDVEVEATNTQFSLPGYICGAQTVFIARPADNECTSVKPAAGNSNENLSLRLTVKIE